MKNISLIVFFYFVSDNAIEDFKDLQNENNKYLYTYTLIGMINSFATFFRAFIFAYGGIKACKKIHDCLLTSIMSVCIFNVQFIFFIIYVFIIHFYFYIGKNYIF